MQTEVMIERAPALAWLEYYPVEGGPSRQSPLDELPFVIGRSEASDLVIDSSRISRRHAEILRNEKGYRLRDLGSTNGTFLNGRQIDEARLHDGDLFMVADVEITFFSGRPASTSNRVTQAIDIHQDRDAARKSDKELVRGVRRMEEMLAHRAIAVEFQSIVALDSGATFAYWLMGAGNPRGGGGQEPMPAILGIDCRLSSRYRHVRRMLAMEQMAELSDPTAVFVSLDEVEIGDASLGGSLARLADVIPDSRLLVAVLPRRAVTDASYFRTLFGQLRSAGIRIAYDGVTRKLAPAFEQAPLRPDYLILAGSLVQEIQYNPRRKQQMEAILQSSHGSECNVLPTGLTSQEDIEFCRGLGCRYGQANPLECTGSIPAGAGWFTNSFSSYTNNI